MLPGQQILAQGAVSQGWGALEELLWMTLCQGVVAPPGQGGLYLAELWHGPESSTLDDLPQVLFGGLVMTLNIMLSS